MSCELKEIKDETANDFVELCSVLKCELISKSAIKAEIYDPGLESDLNLTDLVTVKVEEHEKYDSDASIKEESFEPYHQSLNAPYKTDFNTTHDIQSDSCDRNQDVTHPNDEDSLHEDIFSTQIEYTPTQTKKTVKKNKTINSKTRRRAKKKDDVLFSCGLCSKTFSSCKHFFSHNDLRKSEEKLKIDKQINGCFSHTTKTLPNKKKGDIKFKTVAQMLETLNNSKSKQKYIKSKQKIQQCDQCGQIFSFYNNLLRHQKKHSDGRVICDYCQKDYNRKSYLAEHIKVVHLKIARDTTVFMCLCCKKKVRSAYALRCHMRIHTGQKPYRCEVCKKEFSNKWNFQVHCKSKKHNKITLL